MTFTDDWEYVDRRCVWELPKRFENLEGNGIFAVAIAKTEQTHTENSDYSNI